MAHGLEQLETHFKHFEENIEKFLEKLTPIRVDTKPLAVIRKKRLSRESFDNKMNLTVIQPQLEIAYFVIWLNLRL